MSATHTRSVSTTVSRDGTEIGYWTSGQGPPLLLVHGGFGDHTRWGALRPHLESHVTVHAMDRRGRGASGDAAEYDLAREAEDVAAVLDTISASSGAPVDVYGVSSGASYALAAAGVTDNIRRLVLYEPPAGSAVELVPAELRERLDVLLAAGERAQLVETFFRDALGLGPDGLAELKAQPSWRGRVEAAHTFPRELATPPERWFDPAQAAQVTVPVLMLQGTETGQALVRDTQKVAAALPDVRIALLEGQAHSADLLAPELVARELLAFLGPST